MKNLNKKQKIYLMVGLLILVLSCLAIKKEIFDQKVDEARDDVEYYEGNTEGYYLSEASLYDKLESSEYGFTQPEIDKAVTDEDIDFNAVAYNAALDLLRAGYPLDGIRIIMEGGSEWYGGFTDEQVTYAIQTIIDNEYN